MIFTFKINIERRKSWKKSYVLIFGFGTIEFYVGVSLIGFLQYKEFFNSVVNGCILMYILGIGCYTF